MILCLPFEVIASHMRTDELPTLMEAQPCKCDCGAALDERPT